MMTGLPTVADFTSAVAPGCHAVLAAGPGVPQPVLPGDFERLLTESAAPAESTGATADSVPDPDMWAALARAFEVEPPVGVVPSLQDGAMVAPWLMQVLEMHAGGVTAPDDAASGTSDVAVAMQMQSSAVPVLAQARAAGQPVTPADLPERGTIELAVVPHADTQEPTGPAGLSVVTPLDGMARVGAPPAGLAAEAATASLVPTESQQKLIDVLGDRLSMQAAQGMRQAVIRLDPHLNGSVRIDVRQNANGIAVHLSATHADVVYQLQAIGESLRQDLGARHGGDVTVQVSASRQGHADAGASGGRERHTRDDAPDQGPGRGLTAAGGDASFELVSDEPRYMKRRTT
ncbi:flagellar hook-length control protein FliK [Burkholderia dolosa]|uniref:flagellar hook-length control protein FliK n=1 Tax=Burkholderia dolosa TaxID=152500 RepID=UPI00158FD0CB|nr:flagellar hook-length control protein FliK [Burkholderia dolosa]MBR8460499.1 flagellar hook-length control protein FliK [Burkholderia dolosa]